MFTNNTYRGIIGTKVNYWLSQGEMMAECPNCGNEIDVSPKVWANEILTCPECGEEAEVINLDPIQLALPPREEDDFGE